MSAVFLFGAGASFGSDTTNVPPLGSGLFGELQRFNPDVWGTIAGSLAMEFKRDFEAAMQSVPPHSLAPLQRAMAAYFFEYRVLPSNLYIALATRIGRLNNWSGATCTLNYERLLEQALIAAGQRPFVGNAPPESRSIEICLPHGCCHIFCDAVQGSAGRISFHGFGIQTDGAVSVIGDPREHRARILQDAFPPVMSYFEPNKRTTVGHSFIERQRSRWRMLAQQASTLIIVGVRVHPQDVHIWDPISTTEARVVYCGGPHGALEYCDWAANLRQRSDDRVLSGYFRDEFETICAEAGV